MASFHQTLTLALALIVIVAMANKAESQPRAQTTSFTYDFYGAQPNELLYQGDAHFPSDSTYLRLTKTDSAGTPQQGSIGRLVYPGTVQLWSSGAKADFESTVKFIITKKVGSNNPADGLVFFIGPVNYPLSSDSNGGNLGIFTTGNTSSVFAVEFDIFVNGQWDPSYRHVGIDIGSRTSKSTARVSDSLIGQVVTLRVNYVAATNVISAVVSSDTSTERSEVSYVYDLSALLPQQVQVGLSSSTGEYVAVHDVVSWYFTSTLLNNGLPNKGAYIGSYA